MKADDCRLLLVKNESAEKKSWVRNDKAYGHGELILSDRILDSGAFDASNQI
jgi:hypothetical protein